MSDAAQPNPPPAPAPAPTVPLSVEEYQRLRGLESQLGEFQKSHQAALDAAEAARLKALAEKGQVEEALNQQRTSWEQKHAEAVTRYSQLEAQVFGERKSTVINEALAGSKFVGDTPEAQAGAAAMVRRLLQDDFETVRDGSGALSVREKVTGRPASDVLKERLGSPQFALFFAPQSKGGTGSGGSLPGPGAATAPAPGSVGAAVADWMNRRQQSQSFGLHAIK